MSLVNCPECQAQVSKTATKCPSCGHRLRTPRRGFFGVIFKWGFILFNVLMVWLWWNITGSVAETANTATSDAALTGTLIGGTLGVGMLFAIWFFGDFVLGLLVLFTRPRD